MSPSIWYLVQITFFTVWFHGDDALVTSLLHSSGLLFSTSKGQTGVLGKRDLGLGSKSPYLSTPVGYLGKVRALHMGSTSKDIQALDRIPLLKGERKLVALCYGA